MIDIAKLHFRKLYQFILQATGNAYFPTFLLLLLIIILSLPVWWLNIGLILHFFRSWGYLFMSHLFVFVLFIFPSLRWLKYLLMFYSRMFWFHYLHLNLYFGVRSKDSSFPTSLIATMCQLHLVNDSSSAFPWRS